MGFFNNNDKEGRIGTREGVTTIAKGTEIEGVIRIDCNLQLDGNFKGDILSKGTVIVGEEGNLVGKIVANHIICKGKILGEVVVNDLDLMEGGCIEARVDYHSTIRVDKGGTVNWTVKKIDKSKMEEIENKEFKKDEE